MLFRREFNPLDEYTNKICSRAGAETGINHVQSRSRNRYKSGSEQGQKQVKIWSRAGAETGINQVQSRSRNRYKSGPEQEQ